jgi:hypothetical protein
MSADRHMSFSFLIIVSPTVEVVVPSQVRSCDICGWTKWHWDRFPPNSYLVSSHYAASRKVMGLIPDGVIGVFN